MTGIPVFHWARGNQTPMSPVQDTMDEKKSFAISYGCMADTITKQLNKQGFEGKFPVFDKLKDYANYLRVNGITTDSEYDKCIQRIQKKLKAHLEGKNKTP